MLEKVKRFLGRREGASKQPLEITVQDQWVLKFLFLIKDRYVGEEDIVAAVLEEKPTLIPNEIAAALRKLHLVGAMERDELGRYRVARKALGIRRILQERPSVNIDYYG